jgi:hypothetical protein
VSRLAWVAAWPLVETLFSVRPATWPQRLTPLHLAWLQFPEAHDQFRRDVSDALEQACEAGELPCEFEPFEFGRRYRVRTDRVPWVLAADFLAWLKGAGAAQALDLPPGGSLADKGEAIIGAAAEGRIGVNEAAQLLGALGSLARTIEFAELVRRIEALEREGGGHDVAAPNRGR